MSESENPIYIVIFIILAALVGVYYYLRSKHLELERQQRAYRAKMSQQQATQSQVKEDRERIFTLAELKQYDGSDPNKPIYIGCNGWVHDVTAGRSFYGPGGAYGVFAGRDASRGLALMEVAYTHADISDLTASQRHTLQEWSQKYAKYPVVGRIVDYSEPNSGPSKPAETDKTK